jgi:hypothetical protein
MIVDPCLMHFWTFATLNIQSLLYFIHLILTTIHIRRGYFGLAVRSVEKIAILTMKGRPGWCVTHEVNGTAQSWVNSYTVMCACIIRGDVARVCSNYITPAYLDCGCGTSRTNFLLLLIHHSYAKPSSLYSNFLFCICFTTRTLTSHPKPTHS